MPTRPAVAKLVVVAAVVLLLAVIAAMIGFMWVETAHMSMPAAGWSAVVLMVVFCFGLGSALMFLIFFSARRGHDENAHLGAIRGQADREGKPPDG